MDDQASCVAHIGEVGEQVHRLHGFDAGVIAAFDAEGKHSAGAFRQIFVGEIVERAVFQAGMRHPVDRLVPGQKLRNGLRVGHVPFHPQGQRLDPGDGEKRVHRRHGWSKIPEGDGPGLGGEAEVAESLVKGETVIGGLGLRHGRELAAFCPVELAGFDHHAAHGSAVAAEILGGRVHDNIRAPIDRVMQIGRGHGVVDDHRDAGLTSDLHHLLKINDDAAGVCEDF